MNQRRRRRPAQQAAAPHRPTGLGRLIMASLMLALMAAMALHSETNAPDDPHYLLAQEILADYETMTGEQFRHDDDPTLRRALHELSQVDPASSSAEPAARLAHRLRTRLVELDERREFEAQHQEAHRRSVQERRDELMRLSARPETRRHSSLPTGATCPSESSHLK